MTNNTIETILKRYSCRDFTGRLPADEDLRLIAKAAVAAPSGSNRQLWRVIVVKNRRLISDMEGEGLRMLAAMPDKTMYERIMSRGGKLFYNAPCMMVIPLAKAVPPGAELFDCGIIAENIALAAASLGIDNVICGLTVFCFAGDRRDEFNNRLGFPPGYEIGLSVLLGFAQTPGKPHEPDTAKISFIE
ncbi:MAG: nitroreductase family protein [Spirochaetales bacterium]|jgi:nitroreductase|nr:nitroreductase family protein [Spirochaetales bacterium]